jgi:hypothetical protein
VVGSNFSFTGLSTVSARFSWGQLFVIIAVGNDIRIGIRIIGSS